MSIFKGLAAADEHLWQDEQLRERVRELEAELVIVRCERDTAVARAGRRGW